MTDVHDVHDAPAAGRRPQATTDRGGPMAASEPVGDSEATGGPAGPGLAR